jgi:hypothetical protein
LALVGLFRSRASLEAEILILRHPLNIPRRQSPMRLNFSTLDRLIFAGLYRLAPSILGALAILKPETVIRWHRAGFRSYWRWKSRHRGGRPTVPLEIRELTAWPSIGPGGEARYPRVGRRSSAIMPTASRRWICVVPTISFRLLDGLLIMGHGRRKVLWFGVTAHPTAEWIANQITQACGWKQALAI